MTVSLPIPLHKWLHSHPKNISSYIVNAIEEKRTRETTKEGKIKLLKEQKRSLAKKMNQLDKKIMDLEDSLT